MRPRYVPISAPGLAPAITPAGAKPPPAWDPFKGVQTMQGGSWELLTIPTGLVDDGSGKASAWTDISGAGKYAPAQSTSGKRPQIVTASNGQKGAKFTGAQILDCGTALAGGSGGAAFSVFIIASFPQSPNQYDTLVGRLGAANSWAMCAQQTTGYSMAVEALVSTVPNTGNVFDGTPRQLIGIWDGATNLITRCAGRNISQLSGYTPPLNENGSDHVTIGGAWGSGGTNTFFANATIHAVGILAGVPTATDIGNWSAWSEYYFGATEWKKRIIFIGDSITSGFGLDPGWAFNNWEPGLMTPFPEQCLLSLGRLYGDPMQDRGYGQVGVAGSAPGNLRFNLGYAGHMLTDMTASDVIQLSALDAELDNIFCLDGGRNDIGVTTGPMSLATLQSRILATIAAIRAVSGAAKAPLVVRTLIDGSYSDHSGTGGNTIAQQQALWTSFNAWLHGAAAATLDPSGGPVIIDDVASDPRFGGNGAGTAYGNLTYYQSNGVHPNAAGAAAMGQLLAGTIFGNGL